MDRPANVLSTDHHIVRETWNQVAGETVIVDGPQAVIDAIQTHATAVGKIDRIRVHIDIWTTDAP